MSRWGSKVKDYSSDLYKCIQKNDSIKMESTLKLCGNTVKYNNNSLLYWAIYHNREDCCRVLLKHGYNFLNVSEKTTSLNFACDQGLTNVLLLILSKIQISSSDYNMLTIRAITTLNEKTAMAIINKYNTVSMDILDSAIQNHFITLVQILISKGVKKYLTERAIDPLQTAILAKDIDIVKILIENKLYLIYEYRRTNPIHRASELGFEAAVALMIDKIGGFDNTDNKGNTPLYYACAIGHAKIAQMLLKKGAMPEASGSSPLSEACEKGHIEVVKVFIEEHQNLNVQSSQGTPLVCAIRSRNKEIVKLLLQNGADPNRIGFSSLFPIFCAIEVKDLEVVQWLLDSGANFNQISPGSKPTELSETPLTKAISMKWYSLIELLIETGASTNLILDNNSPLIAAIRSKDEDIVNYLLEHNCLPNLSTADHKYPLTEGVLCGNIEIVRALLKARADPNISYKASPLMEAINKGNIGMVRLLISYGANVNLPDYSKETPLFRAVKQANTAIMDLLIKNKADMGLQINMANSPFDYAMGSGDERLVRVFISNHFVPSVHQFEESMKINTKLAVDILSSAKKDIITNYFNFINENGNELVKNNGSFDVLREAVRLGMKVKFSPPDADFDMVSLFLEGGGKFPYGVQYNRTNYRFFDFAGADISISTVSGEQNVLTPRCTTWLILPVIRQTRSVWGTKPNETAKAQPCVKNTTSFGSKAVFSKPTLGKCSCSPFRGK